MTLIKHRKCPTCGADVQIYVCRGCDLDDSGKMTIGWNAYPICKKNHSFDSKYALGYDEALKKASDSWNRRNGETDEI